MLTKSRQQINAGDQSINVIAGNNANIFIGTPIPTDLVGRVIDEEIDKLRKSRLYAEVDNVHASLILGRRITDGDLSGGAGEIKGRALAWCARLIFRSEYEREHEEFLQLAKTFGDSVEVRIAEAVALSRKEDKTASLRALAKIDSHASYSAGLLIVAHHDGVESALKWMSDSGYSTTDLDADGKSVLLTYQLQLGRWDESVLTSDEISEENFKESPVLHYLVALAKLASTIPLDFRSAALMQVPFEAAQFPLASNSAAIDVRQAARHHFLCAAEEAKNINCPRAERIADEYALWLELRDPEQSAHGKMKLECRLRDLKGALGFVHYAFQFGIKLNLDAVERCIEQNIAMNGGVTNDAAIARFALAFAQVYHLAC